MLFNDELPIKYLESKDGEVYVFNWKEICLFATRHLNELSRTLFEAGGNKDKTITTKLENSFTKYAIVHFNDEQRKTGYLDIYPWRIPFHSAGGAPPWFTFDYNNSDSIYNAAKQRIDDENLTKDKCFD